jgi:hypothetical protein
MTKHGPHSHGPHPSPRGKRLVVDANDTLVSAGMLTHALDAICKRITLDREHDIPYLAGYSRDGKTIYIDRHLPYSFQSGDGRKIGIDRFLIIHEAVEKSLLDTLGLHYQHAHQIALRAEEAAVRAANVKWREYDRFMQQFIKEVGDEKLTRIPLNLDIKPYRDENDTETLIRIQECRRQELEDGRKPPAKTSKKKRR